MDVIPSGLPSGPLSRILDGAIRGVAGAPSYLRKQAELRNFLGRVTEKYTTYCNEIYRNVRILAMPKPIELQQIYTQVRVSDQIQSQQKKPETEIVRSILAGRDTAAKNLSALAVAKSTPRLVLLGRPGSGKSTFLACARFG
jgi:hypothetical protein